MSVGSAVKLCRGPHPNPPSLTGEGVRAAGGEGFSARLAETPSPASGGGLGGGGGGGGRPRVSLECWSCGNLGLAAGLAQVGPAAEEDPLSERGATRLYIPGRLASGAAIALDPGQTHRLRNVLRLASGAAV